MREWRMYAMAATLAAMVVGGLLFVNASKADRRASIRLLSQTNALGAGRVRGSSPGVYLLIEAKRPEPSESAAKIEVVDARGRIYPTEYVSGFLDPDSETEQNYYRVPLGYPNRVDKPRLKAIQGGRAVLDVPLGDFPPPTSVDLKPTDDPPVRLVLEPSRSSSTTTIEVHSSVSVRATHPVGPSEELRVTILETSHSASTKPIVGSEFVEDGVPLTLKYPKSYLYLPYAKAGDVVRLKLERRRSLAYRSQTIRIPGARLVLRGGETEIALPQSPYVVSALGAAVILTEVRPPRTSAQDHRKPRLNLKATLDGKDLPLGGPSPSLSVDILAPRPEALGVSELWVGSRHLDHYSRLGAPPSSKPFELVLGFGRSFGGATISAGDCNVSVEAKG